MPGHQPRVLVIEDDLDIQALMQNVLEHEGFRVSTASDGQEALSMRDRPGLIVLDWMLPGLFGDDLVGRLHTKFPHVPIVVTSGVVELAENARRAKAAGYLPKPFDLDQLRSVVWRALPGKRRPRTIH